MGVQDLVPPVLGKVGNTYSKLEHCEFVGFDLPLNVLRVEVPDVGLLPQLLMFDEPVHMGPEQLSVVVLDF